MRREHEKQAALFHDSWDRLWWVEQQIATVRELAAPWLRRPRVESLRVTIDHAAVCAGRIEFVVDTAIPEPVPPEVNFLVGNIITDARSCLEMAIDAGSLLDYSSDHGAQISSG